MTWPGWLGFAHYCPTSKDLMPPFLWDAATGQEVAALRGHTGDVNSASYSPDGGRIITASSDGTARVWNAAT